MPRHDVAWNGVMTTVSNMLDLSRVLARLANEGVDEARVELDLDVYGCLLSQPKLTLRGNPSELRRALTNPFAALWAE